MHIQAYTHEPRSYRELPHRHAEFGTVYRMEQSGELNGLTRVDLIPVMAVIVQREAEVGQVSIRSRENGRRLY